METSSESRYPAVGGTVRTTTSQARRTPRTKSSTCPCATRSVSCSANSRGGTGAVLILERAIFRCWWPWHGGAWSFLVHLRRDALGPQDESNGSEATCRGVLAHLPRELGHQSELALARRRVTPLCASLVLLCAPGVRRFASVGGEDSLRYSASDVLFYVPFQRL